MKAALALVLLLCAGVGFAADTRTVRPQRSWILGKEYIRLDEWARANGFQWKWTSKKDVLVSNSGWRLEFTTDSKRMSINGVSILLSESVRRGAVPMDWSLDHIGPMTRSVGDSAVLLQAIAGEDEGDTSTRGARVQDYTRALESGAKGMRLGLLRRYHGAQLG